MVLFLLYMKAELENIKSISLRNDANLCLSVKNPLSDYEIREKVIMNASEPIEQQDESSNSREPTQHHLSLKWDGNKKSSILTILTETEVKTALKKGGKKGKSTNANVPPCGTYNANDSGNWRAILAVETRGLEPFAFFPMGNDFIIKSSSGSGSGDDGKIFMNDVDLSDGDWADYDEENDVPISMSDIEFKWESV